MKMKEVYQILNMLEEFGIAVNGPHYHYDETGTRITEYSFGQSGHRYTMKVRKSNPRLYKEE